MSQREFKYDAFISYRHAELDSFVAETLHRLLESFKVPKLADKEIKETGKQAIKRIFRDKDELPLVGNLSDPITEALKESEFLIVICSPRTMESLWVQREIETFLEYGDAAHILAVLIEGEPKESFPPQICKVKQKITAEDGTVSYKETEIEPLAADVRGNSKREIKAKLKKEILRMAAPMLGCEYDDLKQRHRERKIKRQLTIFSVAGSICLIFGAFSTYQAIRIHRQSVQIQLQAEDLMEENRKNRILQSKSLSNTAISVYEDGDKMGALLIALASVPENLDEPERPVVAESTAALSKILQVYENGTEYMPHVMLEHDTITETSLLNEEGTILVSLDQLGQLYSWDVETGKLLARLENMEVVDGENIGFIDDASILCEGETGLVCLDVTDFSIKWQVQDISVHRIAISEDKKMAAVSGNGFISVYNTSTGKEISRYVDEKYSNLGSCMRFSPNGTYLAAALTDYFDNGSGKGILLKTDSMEVVRSYETEFITWDQVLPTDEGDCYVLSYNVNEIGEYGTTINQSLCCFAKDGSIRFEKAGMMSVFAEIELWGENICYADGGTLRIISQADGSTVREIHYNASIRNYEVVEENSVVVAGLLDGSLIITVLGQQEELSQQYLDAKDYNVRHIFHHTNKMIEEPLGSNHIYVYKNALGSQVKYVTETESNVWRSNVTSNNELLLAFDGKSIMAYSLDDEQTVYRLQTEEFMKKIILIEEEKQFLLVGNNYLSLYGLYDGKLKKQLALQGNGYYDQEKMQYVEYDGENLNLYDMKTLEQISSYEIGDFSQCYISGDGKIAVAADYDNKGFYYYLESKKKVDLDFRADSLAVDHQGIRYLVADSDSNQLSIYEFGKLTPTAIMEAKADFIKAMGFSPDGEKVFVSYKDNTVAIYEAKALTLIKSMKDMPDIDQWETVAEGNMELLYNQSSPDRAYLFNEDMELLYEIPSFLQISPDGKTVYNCSKTDILSFPVYNLQMLVDEAKELLDGRQLTLEEKEKYYVD